MYRYVTKSSLLLLSFLIWAGSMLFAQSPGKREAIPIVDVHSHISSFERMEAYLKVSEMLEERYGKHLEVFLDLGDYSDTSRNLGPGLDGLAYLEEVEERFGGRFLTALSDYRISDGLRFSPEELAVWHKRGTVGYKIWVGVSAAIDDPANDPTFFKMEQLGMVGAGVHIAQPYPTRWCDDPIEFWKAHRAWERVLDRHPKLTVVQAHMLDHFNSDEQLDYLRYILETYPHVHLDLAARFQQFHRMGREHLRSFMIEYADRILFGTDSSDQPLEDPEGALERYHRCFQLLETEDTVSGGFYGETPTVGLALPREVLEKIYYKNAVRIFPRIGHVLSDLGYSMDLAEE